MSKADRQARYVSTASIDRLSKNFFFVPSFPKESDGPVVYSLQGSIFQYEPKMFALVRRLAQETRKMPR
jgi:hypothetical protein